MRRSPLSRILLILLLLALLPAVFFTAYELNSLSANEELIGSIYRQQLDAILFSVNQYAWDVASAWTGTVSEALRESAAGAAPIDSLVPPLLARMPPVAALVVTDTAAARVGLFRRDTASPPPAWSGILDSLLRADPARLERLVRFARADYRKLEPLLLTDSAAAEPLILLLFATGSRNPHQTVAGLAVDGRAFATGTLAPKIREAAESGFALAVLRTGAAGEVFSTGDGGTEYRQRRNLWLYPSYELGIALRAGSVEDLVRRRSARNMLLIALLDLVLLAGIWLVYRTIRKEMDLVRLKSDFVSNVSHELRTPLALIRMFAETLAMRRVPTEERKQEYYQTIVQETERLSHLVNTILNYSRMEAGKKRYDFRPVSLSAVVRRVTDTYRPRMNEEGFEVTVTLREPMPEIPADGDAVAAAVVNVLDNAMKYSTDRKEITVTTGEEQKMQYVEVRDRGVGIPREHHEKIFETFYRVASGPVHDTKGTGLGLAIVKHIVDAHGGRIELTSAPGEGSAFRLLFPVARQA